ncbi:MAG: hypothetical protein EI684_01745 [Candidatus Viridilinea halotolerans]|uniref:DUF2029 domain-containing protein n=1 Tax=Candidatus Viridilinea halotolerans TaxID=2491704 RepID=A0A426U9U5_9CHLR|nr:MAG: hypothetical protein EI684_01745 [Candidatus Viridilinea halotolerans]
MMRQLPSWLAVGSFILLAIVLDVTGTLHVYGLGWLVGLKLALVAGAIIAGLAGVMLLWAAWGHASPGAPSSALPRLINLLILAAWLATARNVLTFLLPTVAWWHQLWFVVGACLLGLFVVRPLDPRHTLSLAVVMGLVTRLFCIQQIVLDPRQSDMLPLVQLALQNLTAGQSPYAIYTMPWELPLTYMPLTWLAYLPTYLLGLDLRLTNLVAELVVLGAIVVLLSTKRITTPNTSTLAHFLRHGSRLGHALWPSPPVPPSASSGSTGSPTGHRLSRKRERGDDVPELCHSNGKEEGGLDLYYLPCLLWAWLFLQPSSLNWMLSTTTPVWWACLAVTLALATRQAPGSAVALGLSSAASPFAVHLWPFILIDRWRSHGLGASLRFALRAAMVTLLCILPFMLWDGPMFRYGVWQWFNDLDNFPRMRWELDHIWSIMMGFSGIFWRYDLAFILKPVQLTLVLGVILWFWYHKPSSGRLAAYVAPTLLLFTVFNPVLWPYLYNQGLIAWLMALAAGWPGGGQRPYALRYASGEPADGGSGLP